MKGLFIRIYFKTLILFLCTYLSFFPAWATAKPIHAVKAPPPADSLPIPVSGSGAGWSTTTDKAAHYLEVRQTDPKVVIQWQSFDIGSEAHTHFEQVQDGIALNRIYSSDPSRIFGKLTATGSIYLVNQNGILFGENSRVNLNSLVAASLNIKDADFQNGLWKYNAENYMNAPDYEGPKDVENRGTLESDSGGRIFLLGANVENSGTISAEEGRVILAAGSQVELKEEIGTGSNLRETLTADYTGEAANASGGTILADVGQVGVYGKIVRQDGVIRSLSTIRQGSSIALVASEKVATGKNSRIDSGVKELGEDLVVANPFKDRELKIGKPVDTPDKTWDPILVALSGKIDFPSGDLSIKAGNGGRIYLAPGSSIDVSGSWAEKTAADMVLSAQMNSLELRDEFLQKNGILQGKTIYFLLNEGISIGNISSHLDSRTLSALEHSSSGGTVSLAAGTGDIIVDQGASIDISGGGMDYAAGYVQTTKLVSEGRIYDIADAPDWLTYDRIINYDDNFSKKQKTYIPKHTEGADAGKLTLVAQKIAYEGTLNGSAVQGRYQVNAAEPVDALGYKKSVGTKIPVAGTLDIGGSVSGTAYTDIDPVVYAIVVQHQTPSLASGFDPESGLFPEDRKGVTYLSDDLLSNSGLGKIELKALTGITTGAGTRISLTPGGSLTAVGRRILHQGEILTPGGGVVLRTISNKTTNEFLDTAKKVENPNYVGKDILGPERIELAAGSRISTAGEQIKNLTGKAEVKSSGQMAGGSITLKDETLDGEGVVVRKGAELDVSGGYIIGTDRKITDAGDAGSIDIQGAAIVLDGAVKGHSMTGQNGGRISLHAASVEVVTGGAPELPEGYSTEASLPEYLKDRLVLDDNRFDSTGFSKISLSSVGDLLVNETASLAPSAVKLTLASKKGIIKTSLPLEYIGDSSISLFAGVKLNDFHLGKTDAVVKTGTGVAVTVAPGGTISVEGPGADISGTFNAPAGTISVTTTSVLDTLPLLIRKDARFYALGFNRDSGEYVNDELLLTPENGGEISFSSGGALIMEEGSLADVSGSAPVTLYRTGQRNRLTAYRSASAPGSISLSFNKSTDTEGVSQLNGTFVGNKQQDFLTGASFSLTHTNIDSGWSLTPKILARFSQNGFDHLTLTSYSSLDFNGSQTLSMARGITLDAPVVTGAQDNIITLNAPWIQLRNTYKPLSSPGANNNAVFVANGDFMDADGDMKFSGFSKVSLKATQDIRLSDRYYQNKNYTYTGWDGGLAVTGDLSLTAARIYPTTASEFTLKAGGKISTFSSGVTRTDPIYSALGKLTLEAENIEHNGYIAAPLGRIILNADPEKGRVYLADNSVLTVAGEIAVNYGEVDGTGLNWYGYDKTGKISGADTLIETLPEKSVEIHAHEVIGRDEALINIEGGGTAFGYTFIAGTAGSLDPLSTSGRYVILPNSMGNLPGEAVFLEGNDILPQGVYTLLPEAYAFMEGAIIVEAQGTLSAATVANKTREGYTLAVGYTADQGSGLISSQASLYTIRPASDVRQEGLYESLGIVAGNAGSLEISAPTNILNSRIRAGALNSDYRPGIMTLSGKDVIFSSTRINLGNNFNFDTALNERPDLKDYEDTLYLDPQRLSELGLWELNIGSEEITETIKFEDDNNLTGTRISLTAENDITLGHNAGITGTGEKGSVTLLSSAGKLVMEADSFIRSSYLIGIDAQGMDRKKGVDAQGKIMRGEIKAGKVIQLSSDHLYLTDSTHEKDIQSGFIVEEALWKSFAGLEEIWLSGREEIGFAGNVALAAKTLIVADTPLLANALKNTDITPTFTAKTVSLLNSREKTDKSYAYNTDEFSINADRIFIGQGDVGFSGFNEISLNSSGNLTFVGKGSLNTGNADLTTTAAKVTGTYRWAEDEEGEYTYEALDFTVDAGTGKISMLKKINGTEEANDNIGGKLSFSASSIENSGYIGLTSGVIHFNATGRLNAEGVFEAGAVSMLDGAVVSAKGTRSGNVDYDGGMVVYETQKGTIDLKAGSLTDVSAFTFTDVLTGKKTSGNAGTIAVSAPEGTLDIQGGLAGKSDSGQGGSFLMDAQSFANVSSLVSMLSGGGFKQKIDMRVRKGDVSLDSSVTAREFRLSADEGNLNVGLLHRENDQGETLKTLIKASSETGGGRVELYAGNNLTLSSATGIWAGATGSGADGGEIILGIGAGNNGFMNLGGAALDTSAVDGDDGEVYLRAPLNNTYTDVNLTMNATLTGVSKVTVEGVRLYQDTAITSSDATTWKTHATTLMNRANNISNRLMKEAGLVTQDGTKVTDNDFFFRPGIEVQSTGDLSLNTALDLTDWRWQIGSDEDNKVAPVLTLKAAGNLFINQNILDHPLSTMKDGKLNMDLLLMGTAKDSTRINLAAGAKLSSGDIFAVNPGQGNLALAQQKMIYTEGGDINFASGNNTVIGKVKNDSSGNSDYMTYMKMNYNLGSYTGHIRGLTLGDLTLDGGVIQTATGDISLDVKGDLILKKQTISGKDQVGTIRTTGQPLSVAETGQAPVWNHTYFTFAYNSGGDIQIQTGGSVKMTDLNQNAWYTRVSDIAYDSTGYNEKISEYGWAANYGYGLSATQGIAAMGGGNVTIDAGGDFFAQTGTFGKGDLSVSTRGNLDGRFLNKQGKVSLNSLANFGNASDDQVVEAFDSQIRLTAQGNITLASVLNPTLAGMDYAGAKYPDPKDADGNYIIGIDGQQVLGDPFWNLLYTETASLALTARIGSITLTGAPHSSINGERDKKTNSIKADMAAILPPSLYMTAGKDIVLKKNFYLAPAGEGNLNLYAGNDISAKNTSDSASGDYQLFMSDMDPDDVYKMHSGEGSDLLGDLKNPGLHADYLLHKNDSVTAKVEAKNDIRNIQLAIPKAATLWAGRDIANVNYTGQNLRETDQTTIYAGRDIYFQSNKAQQNPIGILMGGPGLTLVQAGNTIDLGTSQGIQSTGSATNPYLPKGDNDLMVIAGIQNSFSVDELNFFFGDTAFLNLVRAYELSDFNPEVFNGDEDLKKEVEDYLAESGFIEGIDGLRQAGLKFERARAEGNTALADRILADARRILINPLFEGSGNSEGNINLVNSRIFTSGGSGDIFTLARGKINVGLSTIDPPPITRKPASEKKSSGLYTTAGGAVKIFAKDDINVNQSRVMTFAGGDIIAWSDHGDINAGIGSKAAVASSDAYLEKQADGTYKIIYEPPAVGSGIRATAPMEEDAGDIYVTAPEGDIDAGEAGIAGRNVSLAAKRVLNAQNIQATGISIGFAKPAESSGGITGLSGGGGLADAGLMSEESSALASARDRMSEETPEGYSYEPKWVDVQVIGFDEEDEEEEEDENNEDEEGQKT
ncbi:MAG: filamentous hemagglutinin family protein [Desulfobacula sp.]|nr:filamentous hemagglutinin family protein [Desulfobacula sp.]